VSELRQLRLVDAPAVLAFERANRSYFAAFISDRGDEFFDQFTERYDALLAEQEAGDIAFYLLIDEDDGAVLGRFNLYDLEAGTARLGYRVAQHVAGHGVATATVRELCVIAAGLGLHTLTAATSDENAASQRVLIKAGFVPTGPAGPSQLGGEKGTRYQRDLTVE
jgi:ribosomal-protein-alanine N-acetyltransferase